MDDFIVCICQYGVHMGKGSVNIALGVVLAFRIHEHYEQCRRLDMYA